MSRLSYLAGQRLRRYLGKWKRTAAARQRRRRPVSLPCLNSNNSTEDDGKLNELTGMHKRTAFVLTYEIQQLAKKFGIERLGFLTLTFADNVQAMVRAQRRFNSLNTHVLKTRYERAIGVWERQKSGRLHCHLVVVLRADIRTGADFQAFQNGDYRSANLVLRSEWAFWRKTAPNYRFGRTELLPVRSTADGIAKYVGKYVQKHIGRREHRDKGARLVRFIGYAGGQRTASTQFAWASTGSWQWRVKVKKFAAAMGCETLEELQKLFGSRWAYVFRAEIMEMPLAVALGDEPLRLPRVEKVRPGQVLEDLTLDDLPLGDENGPLSVSDDPDGFWSAVASSG